MERFFFQAIKWTAFAASGLFPLALIAYFRFFVDPALSFKNFLFHEIAIAVAVAWSAFVAYVAYQCYRTKRETFLRYMTLGFLGQAIVYSMHGLLTRTANDIPVLFILYGPASRIVMAAFLSAAILKYGTEIRDNVGRRSWFFWIGVFVLMLPAVALLAVSPIGTEFYVRAGMETLSIIMYLAALGIFFYRRINTPLMWLYAVALSLFAQSSLAFILVGMPWDHMFWFAHLIFAAGFLVVSYGLVQARNRSSSFAEVFSEDLLYSKLSEEVSKQKSEIEARKRAEESLRQAHDEMERRVEERTANLADSEARLKAIIESSPGAVVIRDLEGRNLIANKTFAEWYHVDRDKIVGKATFDDLPPATRDETVEQQRRVLDTKKTIEAERRMTFQDGVTRDVFSQVFPIFSTDGECVAIGAIVNDITESKRTVLALRESENLLNSIIENVPVALLIKDSNHVVERANSTYLKLYGFEAETLMNRWSDEVEGFQAPDEATAMTAQEREVLATGKTLIRHVERPFSDGEIHTIAITKFPIYDLDGNITKVGSVGFDLTEQVRANTAKSEFLAVMSHDLRTPLNAILGFAEIISLERFGPSSERYREYAKDIYTSGEHLLALVNDMLDLSAIEAGKKSLTMEYISITDIVRECEAIVAERARSSGVELETNVPEAPPPLYADGRAFKQILLNLLSNAIKFTSEGGRITLTATITDEHQTVVVNDTGMGIPADQIKTVTDPFIRGQIDPHKAQEGTGLGLTIVKSLVDLHDGKLDIRSTVGEGTTISVTLPNRGPGSEP